MKHAATEAVARPRDSAIPGLCEREQVYLYPGQMVVFDAPHAVVTILGSCVALCLCDPVAGVGGINHFVLPSSDGRASLKYGDMACTALFKAMLLRGARRDRLEARVFGGASVLATSSSLGGELGMRNAAEAVRAMEQEKIPIRARDVGGRRGRRLVYFTDDGSAWVRLL